jgi:hypothetical protein
MVKMKNELVLCKNFTKNGDPIDKTNRFSQADPFVVGMAILDNWETNSVFNLEMIWKHKMQTILHQRRKFKVDPNNNRHRFESFIKMAFVEYKNLYGPWNLSLIINDKECCNQDFVVIKPMSIYGNNYKINNMRGNSVINIAY